MSFPRYPAYKDSGVEWLGQVPKHWIPKELGAISSLKGRLGWQGLKADEYRDEGPYVVSSAHFNDYEIEWDECPRVSRERYDTDINIQLAANDLLLMKDGAAMGKLAFVDRLPGPACLNSHLLLFRPVKIDGADAYFPRFAFYCMQTGYFQEHIKVRGTGATFLGISQDAIGRYQVVLPPLTEQKQIAAFLDRETAKIDGLVAEQQRLMELLKEKRQAVISHAVTKGLNPDVPMKPSDIEWLGDVPAHWAVVRIASLFREVAEAGTDELPILSVSIHHGVSDREFDEEEVDRKVTRSEDRSKYNQVVPGDLVYNMMRAWQGGFGTVAVRGMVSPAYVVARPKEPISTTYIEHLLRTPRAIEQMRRHSRGVTDFRLRLYWDEFRNIRVTMPPQDEAVAICAKIAEMETRFDSMSAECVRSITLLQERRTALISAAVTGQIDVRSLSEEQAA